jgi:hypothetical protein
MDEVGGKPCVDVNTPDVDADLAVWPSKQPPARIWRAGDARGHFDSYTLLFVHALLSE